MEDFLLGSDEPVFTARFQALVHAAGGVQVIVGHEVSLLRDVLGPGDPDGKRLGHLAQVSKAVDVAFGAHGLGRGLGGEGPWGSSARLTVCGCGLTIVFFPLTAGGVCEGGVCANTMPPQQERPMTRRTREGRRMAAPYKLWLVLRSA
jgi:hypothetical protein